MRWFTWIRKRRWEQRMASEFRFHMETQVDEYVRQGVPRDEAEQRVRREFGPVELAKDECRDQKPTEWLEQLFRDTRYALRSLRRAPGFTATAIVTLALGIGANTAVFSVVHSVLLRALPYPEPDRLIALVEQANLAAVNLLEYAFWKEHSSAFSSAAAHGGGGERNLVVGARREWIRTRFVSADFFRTLGVAPSAGREFTPEETRRGGPPAVILSDEASRRVFSENESPLGRVVTLGDANFTVVGVLPRGFWFIEPADAFLPLRPSGGTSDGGANYQMIARLKPSNADRRRCSALEH